MRSALRTSRSALHEVVVAPRSPLVGCRVRDTDFRARYQGSIVAVHRSGHKLEQKIGLVVLQAGDALLIDADEGFARRWRNSNDFILVSQLADTAPIAHRKAWIALAIFGLVVASMSVFPEDSALPLGPIAVLAALVVLTGLLTELLSNNACAALMASLAFALAQQMQVDPRPFLVAVAATSSYGFAPPIGYRTNLMVMNPGGYTLRDYLRVGIPLDLLCWTLTIVIVAVVWRV